MAKPTRTVYRIESIDRAINILMAFTHAGPELTLGDLVAKTGLAKTTVFRMLSTLCARHMCQLDPVSGRYSLGFEVLKLADVRRQQMNLRAIVLPAMMDIRDVSNETVVLSVREGDDRVNIDYVESHEPLRRVPEPGHRAPLYAGAASKALLACMDDQEIDKYLKRVKLEPFLPNTITDVKELRKVIDKIRRRGYSESRGERTVQGNAIAVPIRDLAGNGVCAISVSYVDNRFNSATRTQTIEALLEWSRRLSQQFGAGPS